MPGIDTDHDHPDDAIYPQALGLMNATLSEIFTGRWTRASRLTARRARLAARHQAWMSQRGDRVGSSASTLALAVVGPCRSRTTDVCCDTLETATAACWTFSACGCKVIGHVEHPGRRFTADVQLEAELRTAAELTG